MPRPEPSPDRADGNGTPRIDWRAWLALAWAAWFGVLYVRMVLECRAPGVLAALRHLVGR